MILNPYILKDGEPIRRLFLKVPYLRSPKAWEPGILEPTEIITLDILVKEEKVNILLGRPDWNRLGLANFIDVISSNLIMLMEASGVVKNRKNVQWFEIVHSMHPIRFQSIIFQNDDDIWLSNPSWKNIPIEEIPFNVDRYRVLLNPVIEK